METCNFYVICRDENETKNVLNFNYSLSQIFTHRDNYYDLYDYFNAYLNDVEDGEDFKFVDTSNNNYSSHNIDGFSESCYKNNYCLLIDFRISNNKIVDWSWNKVKISDLSSYDDLILDYSNFISFTNEIDENKNLLEIIEKYKIDVSNYSINVEDTIDNSTEDDESYFWDSSTINIFIEGNFVIFGYNDYIRKDSIVRIKINREDETIDVYTNTFNEPIIYFMKSLYIFSDRVEMDEDIYELFDEVINKLIKNI